MHAPHRTAGRAGRTAGRTAALGLAPTAALAALAALTALTALGACGGSAAPAPAPPGAPAAAGSGGDTGCAREIAIRCMNGVDGCDSGRTIEHVCVAPDAVPGPPCAQEIALECPPGQRDGCLFQPAVSLNHICVYE